MLDVHIEHHRGMSYFAWYEEMGIKQCIVVPRLRDKPEGISIKDWASKWYHTPYEIEAAVLVYFDIWNFRDGDPIYKEMYDAFSLALEKDKSMTLNS